MHIEHVQSPPTKGGAELTIDFGGTLGRVNVNSRTVAMAAAFLTSADGVPFVAGRAKVKKGRAALSTVKAESFADR
jgi:hypothetical protein